MKTSTFNLNKLSIIVIFLFALNSCSKDGEPENVPGNNKPDTEIGRFDNSPFVWDDVFPMDDIKDKIYIGDLPVLVQDVVSIINPPGIYIGAAYPVSSLPFKYDREITHPRNPIDLIFDFRLPFIAEVTRETGSVGYTLALKDAVASNDYKTHVSVDNYSVSASMTRFNSYKDVEKGFSGNAKLGSLFSARVQDNGSQIKKEVTGRLFARLINSNFLVYMDIPPKGLFKNPDDNKTERASETNVYLRSITYGKVVYVAIESEYDYSDLKFALETKLKYSSASSNAGVIKWANEILQKSAVTIFTISDKATGSYFYDAADAIEKLFKIKYTSTSYGFPIFIQCKYVHNNSTFYLSDSSGGTSRPSYRKVNLK